jgi:predicted ATPase
VSDGRDQWYVITGPPCSGKSTTVELLAQRGFRVRSEIARAYVNEEISKGRKIEEIRSDMPRFQCEVLRRALASEEALPRDEVIYFDRGIPDSLAYFLLHGISPEPYMRRISSSKYRKVFYLDPLDNYMADYARIESLGERDQLARLLWKAYSDLEFCIERVPALPRLERIEYILARVS